MSKSGNFTLPELRNSSIAFSPYKAQVDTHVLFITQWFQSQVNNNNSDDVVIVKRSHQLYDFNDPKLPIAIGSSNTTAYSQEIPDIVDNIGDQYWIIAILESDDNEGIVFAKHRDIGYYCLFNSSNQNQSCRNGNMKPTVDLFDCKPTIKLPKLTDDDIDITIIIFLVLPIIKLYYI
ncbi:uncharacterized protein LOC128957089 [Oppia nitens]|uniref:uncharacterized protein LOC128957089 n=1 Tax=Oppia nitens TaxID=1686743 RepID=UPI0023DBB9A4|nr:uncharacterized protein LOC128957089 [Oppia nitens]